MTIPRRVLLTAFMTIGLSGLAQAGIRGHARLPDRLEGLWEVSLCVSDTHAWIGYRNVMTGETHTCGRYARGYGGVVDAVTGRCLWPPAYCWGVLWDWDMLYAHRIRRDSRVLRSAIMQDPVIYRGLFLGYGHLGVRLNCTTYARDVWYNYTGEYYPLPLIASPRALEERVAAGSPR